MPRVIQRFNITSYEAELRRYERRRRVIAFFGGVAVICGLAVVVDLFF